MPRTAHALDGVHVLNVAVHPPDLAGFHEPTGEFRNFYCNINTPPIFKNSVLDYIDLDIDVVVDGKGIITILDIEEFRENSLKYSIPDSIQTSVYTTLEKILLLIRSQEFPFDDDEARRR